MSSISRLGIRHRISVFLFALSLFFSLSSRAATPQCWNLAATLETLPIQTVQSPAGGNLFAQSIIPHLASAATWLTAVQLIRSYDSPPESQGFFAPAFLLTVPVDLGLVTITHAVGLSPLPWLKKIWSGEYGNPKTEFFTRAGTNITIGSVAITLAWAASGIDVTPTHCGAAAGLCLAVYPTLQWIKTQLYRVRPVNDDLRLLRKLEAQIPNELGRLKTSYLERTAGLGLDPDFAENAFMHTLDSLVLSLPYEDRIRDAEWNTLHKKNPNLRAEIQTAREGLDQAKTPSEIEAKSAKLKRLRRVLVNGVLKNKIDLERILELGTPFTPDTSVLFQEHLAKRSKAKKWRLISSSVVDQMIAVGIAGGVFLYGVNHWAQTGELPWFIPGG